MDVKPQKKAIQVKPRATNKDWDQTFQLLSWWKTDVVQEAKVMIVGAGALGNEVLKNLTLMNVGNILIVDFDHIEYANLSRSVLFREEDTKRTNLKSDIAAQRIKEINPRIKIKTINGDVTIDVGLGVFRRMDVIIGCLDNRLARLFLNRACYKVDKTWIDGAIENLIGQVNVYTPEVSCYECSLSEKDWQNIHLRLGCPTVAMRNYSQGRIPTTPISASIVGAIQVQEALKVISGNDKQSMAGQSFYYEGMNNFIMQLETEPLREVCYSHYWYDPIVESPLSTNSTLRECFSWLEEEYKDSEPIIKLDNDLALQIVTRRSDKSFDVVIPKLRLTDEVLKQFREDESEDIIITAETNELDPSFEYLDKTLGELGIPALHILRVLVGGEMRYVELTKDEAFLNFE